MKIALIDVKGNDNRSISNNISVNIRNLEIIKKYLKCDFYYNTDQLNKNKNKYDVLLFGFGSGSSNINEVVKFVKGMSPKRIFWLVGDYEQTMNPSLFYACKELNMSYSIIRNYQKNDDYNSYCLNINLLVCKEQNKIINKKYDCVYWSRWRPNRKKYLSEYLQNKIYLSTSVKNMKQYKHIGCNPIYLKPLSWSQSKETLNLFKYSLYIEDEYTHNTYNHMANRFYEALFCNVVQFFDINCKNSIQQSGLVFDNYFYVRTHSELIEKINETNKGKNWGNAMSFQSEWNTQALKQKPKMLETLKNIIISS